MPNQEPDNFGLTTRDVQGAMLRGVPEIGPGDMVVARAGGEYKVVILKNAEIGGANVLLVQASLTFRPGRSASFDNITLDHEMFGRGLGPRLCENALRVCFWLNIPQLDMEAGAQMGAYVWGRSGARVAAQSREVFAQEITPRIMAMKPDLPFKVFYKLQDATQLRRDGDLQVIAHCDVALDPAQVRAALGRLPDPMLARRMANNPLIRRSATQGRPVSVAQFTLAATSYHGFLPACEPISRVCLDRGIRKSGLAGVLACG